MMTYDLIIIGAGPAGYLAAERAGHNGLNTLLIEKRFIGGVCLNEGCIPTKTLLYSAKIFDSINDGEKYGVSAKDAVIDHKVVIERKNRVVRTLVAGVKSQLKKNNVTIVEGTGKIIGKNSDDYSVQVSKEIYNGKRILIATGSMPFIPPIIGLKEELEKDYVLTSSEILNLEKIPSSLVVIGGGIIGLEIASYFNSIGCKVTIIEILDHIAQGTDREISEILKKDYEKKGITFILNSKVTEIKNQCVTFQINGEKKEIAAEKILISTGRKPVITELGLENINIEIENGKIKTDEKGKTNIPNVYAAGDVNGISMLAHTAYREAEVCINNIIGNKDLMRYHAIPSIIYTNPEVASVGETEESAKAKGIDYEIQKTSMRYSGRYLAENEGGNGICKILIDKKYKKLIGVHMIGNYSSEIIYGVSLMIETEMRIKDVKEIVFPHPTVSEIIREAVFQF